MLSFVKDIVHSCPNLQRCHRLICLETRQPIEDGQARACAASTAAPGLPFSAAAEAGRGCAAGAVREGHQVCIFI